MLKVISALGSLLITIGVLGFCILLCAYTCVACSDPGIVYRKKVEVAQVEMSDTRTEHDEDSARLIDEVVGSLPSDVSAEVVEVDAVEARRSKEENAEHESPIASSNLKAFECGICNMQRPSSARHCYYCRTCKHTYAYSPQIVAQQQKFIIYSNNSLYVGVDELDHHCPWSGKCIGKRNMHFFTAFLTSLCCQTYFLIGAFIYYCYAFLSIDGGGHLRGDSESAGNHTLMVNTALAVHIVNST